MVVRSRSVRFRIRSCGIRYGAVGAFFPEMVCYNIGNSMEVGSLFCGAGHAFVVLSGVVGNRHFVRVWQPGLMATFAYKLFLSTLV